MIYLWAYQIFPILRTKFLRYEVLKHDLVVKKRSQIISQSCVYGICLACLDRNCGAINYAALTARTRLFVV